MVYTAGYSSSAMTAYNNYWRTTDSDIIETMIFDKNDDLSSAGYIPFIPYLTSHHIDTPVPDDEDNDGVPDIINGCLE